MWIWQYATDDAILQSSTVSVCDEKFSQIEGNGRTFSNIKLCNAIAQSDKIF